MLSNDFVHCHLHTVFSVNDGAIKIKPLIKKLKANGMTACAITDHGKMYGVVDFYMALKDEGIKPIIGYESYTAPDNDHLILLAMNNDGYKNLVKICAHENVDGFKQAGKFAKGNLDLNWVWKNKLGKGIIALTACIGGTTCQRLLKGDRDGAKKYVLGLKATFEEVYIELQDNTTKDQAMLNLELINISKDTGIPLVLTKDAHYLNKEDYEAHDALLAIQINKQLDDPTRWKFPGGADYYVATPQEMQKFVRDNNIPEEAYNNTIEIANKCNVELVGSPTAVYHGSLFPDYLGVPIGHTQESLLKKLAMDGLIDFIKSRPKGYAMNVKEYLARLNHEVNVICKMGYCGYFLILWDFMKFCKDYRDADHPNGIGTGTGRGSGVGSLVCRVLNITKVDPIKYHLLFERFLNIERDSPPDVDLDIADTDRHLVIEYLMNKWTIEKVGQIVTFMGIKIGGGVRTLMRLKGYDKKAQDEVCKYIPSKFPDQTDTDLHTLLDIAVNPDNYKQRFDQKFDQALRMSEDFTKALAPHPWILKYMEVLEDCFSSTSAHAGGVLIYPTRSDELVPSNKASGAAVVDVCQFEMHVIEILKLLKIDVLGLTTSRIISNTANNIIDLDYYRQTKQIKKYSIDLDNINYEDDKVFEMLRGGHTTDVFQFGSPGMTKACIDGCVSSIEDLIAIVSLYRPGPLDAIDADTGMTIYETFINCKQTGVPKQVHPRLQKILEPTMGNIVYQEQIMQIVMEMAGCSLGYADIVRRAISKKKASLMAEIGKEFKYGKKAKDGTVIVIGAVNNGFTEEEAEKVWDMMRKFAAYCFNKSHAAAYAINAYQTAYEKYYHTAEFMAEALTAESDKQEEVARSVKECRRLGVPVLPPDVNKSEEGFTVEILDDGRKAIRFGLSAIKGIQSAEPIKQIRPITGIDDFFTRVNATAINKSKAVNLILVGALDEFNSNRHEVHNHYFGNIRKDKAVDPATFETLKKAKKHSTSYVPKDVKGYFTHENIRFDYEKALIGMFISGHPLDKYDYKPWSLVGPMERIEQVGILRKVNVRQDRYNRAYAFFRLECLEDVRECVMWANDYAKYGDRIIEGKTVKLRGVKKQSRDDWQFVVSEALVKLNTNSNANQQPVAHMPNMAPMMNPMDNLYEPITVTDIIYGGNQEPPIQDLSKDLFGASGY